MTEQLLLDNSAWARLSSKSLPESRVEAFAEELEAQRLGVCLPFMLEAAYSALNARDHDQILAAFEDLPRFPIEEECERWALEAHRRLARVGHHRIPTVDIMIAAVAHHYRVGVLHYDSDFDLIREKTQLDFESVWLMPRGSLT